MTYINSVYVPYAQLSLTETPDDFVATLELLQEGIKDVGLEPSDHTRYFAWTKHDKNTVGYVLDYIELLINRGEDTILWRDDLYSNKTVSEINDLYEEKMDNLHEELDDVSIHAALYRAYLLKTENQVFLFKGAFFMWGMIFIFVQLAISDWWRFSHQQGDSHSFWWEYYYPEEV